MDGPFGGVLAILIATGTMAVVFGVVAYAGEIVAVTVRAGRFLHVIPEPDPTPVGMPLERIAAFLRLFLTDVPHAQMTPPSSNRQRFAVRGKGQCR